VFLILVVYQNLLATLSTTGHSYSPLLFLILRIVPRSILYSFIPFIIPLNSGCVKSFVGCLVYVILAIHQLFPLWIILIQYEFSSVVKFTILFYIITIHILLWAWCCGTSHENKLKYYYSFNDHCTSSPAEVISQYWVTSPPISRYSCGQGSGFVTTIHVTIMDWTRNSAVVVIIIRMVFFQCFREVDSYPHIADKV